MRLMTDYIINYKTTLYLNLRNMKMINHKRLLIVIYGYATFLYL